VLTPDPSSESDARTDTPTIRILGEVAAVAAGGRHLRLPSVSQRRLVAVLALEPGATLRRDLLCDLLGITPGALRTTMSRLRNRLGPRAIRTEVIGYRLTSPVDAAMFVERVQARAPDRDRIEVLDEALGLWSGDALDEFSHEPWAEADVARLDEMRCSAVEERAELLIEASRAPEAVATLKAHVLVHPLRDRPRGLLIWALAAEGRQADALREFQSYRSILAEETGTEPSEEVRSLERRVAAGPLMLGSGPPGISGNGERRRIRVVPESRELADPIPFPAAIMRSTPPVGRRAAMTSLEAELRLSMSGRLRAVLISGEAGIGKTTLIGGFARGQHAAGRVCVLYGRCHEGVTVPFQPFREAIAPVVERPSETVGAPGAVSELLRRLASHTPLVLVLDDLQWAEPSTLRLLRELVGDLAASPVLLIASIRRAGSAADPGLRSAVAELDRCEARRIPLGGLDDLELAELVTSSVGPESMPTPALLDGLRHETAGNPLYAAHLVRWWSDSGALDQRDGRLQLVDRHDATEVPPNLNDLLWCRVHSLGSDVHAAMEVASVLGVDFDEDVLAEVADMDADVLSAALGAAIDAGLLHDSVGGSPTMRFAHALVARALYCELRGARRRELHRRAAKVLHSRCSARQPCDGFGGRCADPYALVQIARHSALAGELDAAMLFASAAGDLAGRLGAPAEAAAWYRRALDHAAALQRPDLDQADLMARLAATTVTAVTAVRNPGPDDAQM
jgi:DNA-binding SARP family transcriptional activator